MQVTPQDLDELILQLPREDLVLWPNAGIVSAFIRACDLLQPEMVWAANDLGRADWLASLEDARFWVQRSLSGNARDGLELQSLVSLAGIAQRTWRGPGKGPARQLLFVKDAALRAIAERDLTSLSAARRADETKVALILAGCIVECLLTHVLEHSPAASEQAARQHPDFGKWGSRFDPKDMAEWNFGRKICVCGPNGLKALSDKTEDIANTVRDWRNLVHPHLERAEARTAPLRSSDAAVAEALVLKIIDELGDWRARNP